jgi:hypothetical protein
MDQQQEMFTRLLLDLKAAFEPMGYEVYDSVLPPEGTKYPFVYLGDCRQSDTANKSAVFGHVYQTIHVWHDNPKKRGTVSNMLLTIKNVCRQIEHTDNCGWLLANANARILSDNTTKTPLLHGVVEAEFLFS